MRKGPGHMLRQRRPRRPWWLRKRWWSALGIYGLGLSLVLGHLADRRVQPQGRVESAVASGPDTQPMSRALETAPSAGWSADGLSRGWVATPDNSSPPKSAGNGKSSAVRATWIARPETRQELPLEQGPGLKDVKMVTFELPDLKNPGR